MAGCYERTSKIGNGHHHFLTATISFFTRYVERHINPQSTTPARDTELVPYLVWMGDNKTGDNALPVKPKQVKMDETVPLSDGNISTARVSCAAQDMADPFAKLARISAYVVKFKVKRVIIRRGSIMMRFPKITVLNLPILSTMPPPKRDAMRLETPAIARTSPI
ncbi:MAG TPA: hypothetical protein VLH13_04910 [Methanomassiliicoccales archaeon]|nr:hypothetical protein [Methanomassiliicoccales archaeon]